MADLPGANLKNANLTGADLKGANLEGANLTGAVLAGAELNGVKSGKIIGRPLSLPDGWGLVDGTLFKAEWGSSNPPDDMMTDGEDPSDMMADGDDPKFDDIDTDSDGCISWEEFTEKSQKRN
jgi:hypothetical protein